MESSIEYWGCVRIKAQKRTVFVAPKDNGKYKKTRIESHTSVTTSCEFDPTGNYLLSSNDRGQINICNVVDAFDIVICLKYHWKPVTEVHYSQDGTRLYSSSVDRSIVAWDVERYFPVLDFIGHTKAVNTVQYSRADEFLLCSGSVDKTIRIWDLRSGESALTFTWKEGLSSTCFSCCGKYVFGAGHTSGAITILDLRMNESVFMLTNHTGPATGLSLSPCGKILASNAADDTLRTWNVSTLATKPTEIRCLNVEQETPFSTIRCAWSSDGSMLTCGTTDRHVLVFDEENGKLLHRLDGHKGTVTEVNFHPRESLLMSAGTDGFLILHDI